MLDFTGEFDWILIAGLADLVVAVVTEFKVTASFFVVASVTFVDMAVGFDAGIELKLVAIMACL